MVFSLAEDVQVESDVWGWSVTGARLSPNDAAALAALEADPNYRAYIAAVQAAPGLHCPSLREIAAAAFYSTPDCYAVDLH